MIRQQSQLVMPGQSQNRTAAVSRVYGAFLRRIGLLLLRLAVGVEGQAVADVLQAQIAAYLFNLGCLAAVAVAAFAGLNAGGGVFKGFDLPHGVIKRLGFGHMRDSGFKQVFSEGITAARRVAQGIVYLLFLPLNNTCHAPAAAGDGAGDWPVLPEEDKATNLS